MNDIPAWLREDDALPVPAWLRDQAELPAWLRNPHPTPTMTAAERSRRAQLGMAAMERAHRERDARHGVAHVTTRERMLAGARAMHANALAGHPVIMGSWFPPDVLAEVGFSPKRTIY